MGELIVVTGPPGAGKSTVAALLADSLDRCALIPGDDFFAFLHTGAIAPWLSTAHEQNTAIIEAAAASAGRVSRYCDVVYEGVVVPAFRSTFVTEADVEHVHYAVLLPPLDVCLDRVAARQGHGFTDLAAAEHMWREFRRAALESRHEFDAGSADPAELAQQIATRVADQSISFRLPARSD